MPTDMSKHKDAITNYMYLGLLPFFAGALGPWVFADDELWLSETFLLYSTIIFSFLAGSIWAIALFTQNTSAQRHMTLAIVFSLVPFLSYVFPLVYHTGILLLGFLLLLFWEKLFFKTLYPTWYQSLRHRITFMVIACHMLVIWNLIRA